MGSHQYQLVGGRVLTDLEFIVVVHVTKSTSVYLKLPGSVLTVVRLCHPGERFSAEYINALNDGVGDEWFPVLTFCPSR